MKVAFITFGCKTNQYDTEYLRTALRASGVPVTDSLEEADTVVVNTCFVTHKAERDARKAVNRMKRLGKRVLATGCMARFMPVPGADFSGDLEGVLQTLGVSPGAQWITSFGTRTRAFVKIQEGCDFACSYCVIRFTRGPARSRPLPEVLEEIRALRSEGYREIVITGTQVGDWGKEWGMTLTDLMVEIAHMPGEFRVRLSSIEPTHITEDLLALYQDHPERLAPHLHIPLQSASDRVLRAMNRPYTFDEYRRILDRVLEAVPDAAIGTDLIAGFPTETEEDFEEGYQALESLPFAYFHVFEYSARPGTETAALPELPSWVKRERVKRLLELGRRKKAAFIERLFGRQVMVLVESQGEKTAQGLSEHYIRVHFLHNGADSLEGLFVPVRITGSTGSEAQGTLVEKAHPYADPVVASR